MKERKWRKGRSFWKKMLSGTLALLMVSATLADPAAAASTQTWTTTPLESSRLQEVPEGEYMYLGTASTTVKEADAAYTTVIYREGDLSSEASVEVRTIDFSAVYGKDYVMLTPETQKTGDGKTILEKYMTELEDYEDYENALNAQDADYYLIGEEVDEDEASKESESADEDQADETADTSKTDEAAGETYTEVKGTGVQSADSTSGKSALAALKEEQTGEETRELYKTEYEDLLSAAVDELVPQMMDEIDYSSSTIVTFEPGESEKTIAFRIKDDNKSEGTETFSIRLTNAEGAELYNVTSLSVTIEDDEEQVKSAVSFAKKSYNAKNGEATVTVKRKGAEYSLIDMRIMSCEDTAKAGENYEEVNEVLAFAPYETEKEFTVPVCGEGSFSLMLTELTACEEGKYTETVINIVPVKDESAATGLQRILRDSSSNSESTFNITIGSKTYEVVYVSGQSTGKIMDTSYTPNLEVGTYYFSMSKDKGGIFNYGTGSSNFSGDTPSWLGVLNCDYQQKDVQHNSYGRIEYCSPTAWHKAKITAYSDAVIPSAYYQYIVPDWEAPSDSGNNLRFYFQVPTIKAPKNHPNNLNDEDETCLSYKIDQNSGFERTAGNASIKLLDENNKSYNQNMKVSVSSADETGNCPKSYLYFYGVACMYQKYRISISSPNTLSFKTGTGSEVSIEPVNFFVQCGAQTFKHGDTERDIYVNTDSSVTNLVFSLEANTVNNVTDKFGKLTGYTITIDPGNADDKVTLNYPADFKTYLENSKGTAGKVADYSSSKVDERINQIDDKETGLAVIPYDIYFMDWINSAQKNVVSDGNGYYQKLTFAPKFDYIDCTVQVVDPLDDLDASFTDATLSKKGTYTFHAGDVLDLSAVSNMDVYNAVGYSVSTDNGLSWDDITSKHTLTLLPGENYIIRPLLSENDNCIEIRYSNELSKSFNVYGVNYNGVIDESLLTGTELSGKTILELNSDADTRAEKIAPEVGKVYTINIAPFITQVLHTKTYYPIITDAYGNVYNTTSFHYTARQKKEDNVLTLDYVAYQKSISEPEEYTITGKLVSEYDPIIATGTETPKLGVSGYTVTSGKNTKDVDSESGNMIIKNVNALTDDQGRFTLEGVNLYSLNNTVSYTTLAVSNGHDEQVIKIPYDLDAMGGDKTIDVGEVSIDYPRNAPRVASLTYRYDKDSNNMQVNSTSNSVRIFDDNFNMTIVVDDNDNNVTKAIFEVRTANGLKYTASEVAADADNPGLFTCTIKKMTNELRNGDRIQISLVMEDNGVEYTHPAVDSGLVFMTENTILVEQYFDTNEVNVADVPLLGALDSKSSSGLLSFSRTNWDDGSGYTISINIDALYASKGTPSTQEKRALAQNLVNKANEAGTYKSEAEYFGSKNADMEYTATGIAQSILNEGGSKVSDFEPMWDIAEQMEFNDMMLKKANANGAEAKAAVANYGNGSIKQVDVLFLMAFDFVLDPVKNEYIFCSGAISAGGSFNYSKTFYYVVYGAPVFINLVGFAQGDATYYYPTPEEGKTVSASDFENYEGNIANRLTSRSGNITIGFGFKVSLGLGMCSVLGAGSTASVQLQTSVDINAEDVFGAMLIGSGSIFFDLLVMHVDIPLATGTLGFGTYEKNTSITFLGAFDSLLSSSQSNEISGSESESAQSISLNDYYAGTSDMSGFGGSNDGFITASPTAVSRTVLLDDASERTAPKIIELDNGNKMILFIGNSGDEDALNNRALFWSVCENGNWSKPEILADDGTFDASVTVLQENGKVIAAWVDADGTAKGDSSAVEKLNSLGISAAVYDIASGSWSKEITLVNDEFFNFAPQLNLVDDTLYCSYMKRDISKVSEVTDLLDYTNTYSTMAYVAYDISKEKPVTSDDGEAEQYISVKHEQLEDPLVLDYQCITSRISGEDYMLSAYTVDEDGKLATSGDRELFLSITNLTEKKSYYPVKLTNDSVNQAAPKLTELDGIVYLTWMEEGYLFNLMNVTKLVKGFFHAEDIANDGDESVYRNISSIFRDSDPDDADWYCKTAKQLGLSDRAYEGTGYENAYNGIFKAEQANLTDGGVQTSISDYQLVSNGDDIYIFYTDYDSLDPVDFSVELFGVVYQRDMKENDGISEEWGFGKAVQITDFGKTIDEFDIAMNEDNEIFMVSNHYKQWVNESSGLAEKSSNQLVEIDFAPFSSLSVENDTMNISGETAGGSGDIIDFTVVNDGLIPAEGFTVTLSEVKGSSENVVGTWTYDVSIGSGDSYDAEISWNVPEDISNTSLKLTVCENGVAGGKSYTVTKKLSSLSSLAFSDTKITCKDNQVYLTSTVSNKGNADSSACSAQVSGSGENGKVFGSISVPALTSGAAMQLEIPLTVSADDFNSVGVIEMTLEAISGNETLCTAYTKFVPAKPVIAEINNGAETLSLKSGQTETLTAKAGPWESAAGEAHFTSSDPSVAYVNANGVVKAASKGTAVITVYYESGVSDTINVIVSGSSSSSGSNSSSEDADKDIDEDSKPADGSVQFTDVADDAYYADAVHWAVENGITEGVGNGSFAPDNDCTRAQIVTFLWRSAGSPEPESLENPFVDVSDDAYYFKAVLWAVENGITLGVSADKFAPDATCTRAQAVSFIYRIEKANGKVPESWEFELPFTDVPEWCYEAVAWCCMNEITYGTSENSFSPDKECTRAQIVTFLYRSVK